MARPKALSEKKWEEVIRRVPPLGTESIRSVAKEYGISEGTIRKRVNTHEKPALILANQIAATEEAFENLPLNTQVKVRALVDEIRQMNTNLATAGNDLAIVSKMWAKAAKDSTAKIMFKAMDDDGETVNPERLAECSDEMAPVMKSIQLAKEASHIPLKALEIASKTEKPEPEEGRKIILVNAPDE